MLPDLQHPLPFLCAFQTCSKASEQTNLHIFMSGVDKHEVASLEHEGAPKIKS